MNIFGIYFSVGTIIGCAIAILAIAALIIVSIKSEKKVKVADLDKREKYGDFHGLLTQADFDTKSDDPMLEIYRASRSAAFHPKAVCGHFGNPALASR